MLKNPEQNEICEILNGAKTIAIVGISRNSSRISRVIADYLTRNGYQVVGVNPGFDDADGIKVYPALSDIPFEIDIVNVFRKPETIDEIIQDVLDKKPKVLWLQLGIRNDAAVSPVIENEITVIQDKCIKVEHQNCI